MLVRVNVCGGACTCMYMYIYLCMCICEHVYSCVHNSIHMNIGRCTYVCVCTHVYG